LEKGNKKGKRGDCGSLQKLSISSNVEKNRKSEDRRARVLARGADVVAGGIRHEGVLSRGLLIGKRGTAARPRSERKHKKEGEPRGATQGEKNPGEISSGRDVIKGGKPMSRERKEGVPNLIQTIRTVQSEGRTRGGMEIIRNL